MLKTSVKTPVNLNDVSKTEFYQLIEEGFQAIQEDKVYTIEEVQDELNKMRANLG